MAKSASAARAAKAKWIRNRTLTSLVFSSAGTGSHQKKSSLLNLHRGGVGLALVVDPADFEIVTLVAALEAELDVGVLGDRRTPIGDENLSAVIFEGQFLDEMRRYDLTLGIPDEAGIHRMLDQRLDFGVLSARNRANANGRGHRDSPLPPQPPTV